MMTDKQLIFYSLSQWANYIETGDLAIGHTDAINSGQQHLIKPLTLDQTKFVERLRRLATECLNKLEPVKYYEIKSNK